MGVKNEEYNLQSVPYHLQSEDIYAPLSPIRPTQSSIGQFLVKKKDITDETLGTHYTQYGGIGDAIIPGYTPYRNHIHYRTGVDMEISDPISPRWREVLVKRNVGLLSQPIKENADIVWEAFRGTIPVKPFKRVEKKLFPRSETYELEYIKEQYHQRMLEALEKERAEFENKMYKGKKTEDVSKSAQQTCTPDGQTKLSCTPPKQIISSQDGDDWRPSPPFWYKNDRAAGNVTDITDDHTANSMMPPTPEHSWLEKMAIDRPERYLPGEIHKNAKEPIEDLSKKSGCSGKWQPKDHKFFEKFDPSTVPAQGHLLNDVLARKRQRLGEEGNEGDDLINAIRSQDMKINEANSKQSIQKQMCQSACTKCGCQFSLGSNTSSTTCQNCVRKGTTAAPSKEKLRKEESLEEKDVPDTCSKQKWPKTVGKVNPKEEQRRQELLKVGMRFWTEMINQMQCDLPSFVMKKQFRPHKRIFPDWGLPTT